MIGMKNLERQHKEIKELLFGIKEQINLDNSAINLDALVKNINTLAGKVKIHMNSEDKFLYPTLINGEDQNLKQLAKDYSDEMGNIFMEFNNYKSQFNTKTKILNDLDEFSKESKRIISLLENRISKEDMNLYPKIR